MPVINEVPSFFAAHIHTFIQDEKRVYFVLMVCLFGLIILHFAWPKMAGMMVEYLLYLGEQAPVPFPDDPAIKIHRNPFAH